LYELDAAQQQQAADERSVREAMAASQVAQPQTPRPQPTPSPQPQRQPDIASQREAAAARAYQHAAAIQQMSGEEAAMAVDIARHDQWARANFPELNDPTGRAPLELRDTNPERLAVITRNYEVNRDARARLEALSKSETKRPFKRADAEFESWMAQAHPQYAKGASRKELSATVGAI